MPAWRSLPNSPPDSNQTASEVPGAVHFSGDIYYRYPGETRRIQAPELELLLKERDLSAENRLLHLVARLAESGAHNAAVINLSTGEVTGERGQFLIEESLLDKIKFVTEGRLEEKDGAPTLRVVGDVQPIGAPRVTIQQSVIGSISERHIQDAFLTQHCQYEPKIYIEAQTHLQPLWLPIFFFAAKAKLDLDQLKSVLEGSGSPYARRVAKHVDRTISGRCPAAAPSMATVRTELQAIMGESPIDVADAQAAKRFLQAMRLVAADNVPLERLLTILSDLRTRFGNTPELFSEFRYALATVDLRYFRSEVASKRT